jgi:hypothetical protein
MYQTALSQIAELLLSKIHKPAIQAQLFETTCLLVLLFAIGKEFSGFCHHH